MNERQPYEQHLAEKMQQLPPPMEAEKGWEQMRALLDKEMPRGAGSGGNGRWWIIGMIAGILLTGTLFIYRNNSGNQTTAKEQTAVENSPNAPGQHQQGVAKLPTIQYPPGASNHNSGKGNSSDIAGSPGHNDNTGIAPVSSASRDAAETPARKKSHRPYADAARTDQTIAAATEQAAVDDETSKTDDDVGIPVVPLHKRINQNKLPAYTENSTQQNQTEKESVPSLKGNSASTNVDGKPVLYNGDLLSASLPAGITDGALPIETDQLLSNKPMKLQAGKVSILNQSAATAKAISARKTPRRSDNRDRKFALGLSLPLAFPLADQQALGYNFRGGSNTVSDYIPSPHAQYHLNKRTFFQTELQVVAPQYIRPILMYQEKVNLSSNAYLYNSVYARKLYYFNLPVSVYHSPLPNFFLGTGLQFSSLMSGVAMYENKKVYNNQETVLNQSFNRMSHDSLTNRMTANEIRLLLDVNYYWQRFTVGLRYNQAFGNYTSFRLDNTTGYTYDKNKALFFYLRYNIWEDKKRNQPARSMLTLK